MKRLILIIVFAIFATQTFAQQIVLDKDDDVVCVFAPPYFKKGSHKLDLSSYKNLKVVANEIIYGDDNAKYLITGYASMFGEQDVNHKLSLKRANVVRKVLVDYGVNPDVLNVESGGQTPQFGKLPENNRTVVINRLN